MDIYNQEKAFSEWVLGKDSVETFRTNSQIGVSEDINSAQTMESVKYIVTSAQMHSDLSELTHSSTGATGAVLYGLLLSLSLSSNQPSSETQAHLYKKDSHNDCNLVTIMLDQHTKCLDDMLRLINDVNAWFDDVITIDKEILCARVRLDNMRGDLSAYLYADIYSDAEGINVDVRYNPNQLSLLFVSGIIETARFFLSSVIGNNQLTISTFINQMNQKILSVYETINQPRRQGNYNHRCLYGLLTTYSNSKQTAVSYGEYLITYTELFKKASQFAHFLIKQKIGKGNVVGLMMERRIDWFYCVLGIMQIGSVCLPLDISQPAERLNKMIADSNADCIVISEHCQYKIHVQKEVYCLDDIDLENYERISAYEKCSPEDNAYIIYTSGSSGQPKGIMLNHRGIINHIHTKINVLDLNQNNRFAHNFNFGFVASIWLIFAPIILGAEIVLYDEKTCNDPVALFSHAAQERVTVLEIVPWSLNVFLKYIKAKNSPISLGDIRHIILTGEKVDPHIVNDFYKIYNQNLFNAYGQSECSDDTLHHLFDPNIIYHTSVIGRPSLNTQIYIFGSHMVLKAPGHEGILYIGGDSLSNGYLNNSELTQNVWITNPLNRHEKIFKTNDLVRLTNENTVEYLGRADNQVKLCGNRIEIEDISLAMMTHQDIDDAAVIDMTDDDGNTILYGLYQSKIELKADEANAFLESKLPKYMLPGVMIRLQEIPRNKNGKVDRNILHEYNTDAEVRNDSGKDIEQYIIELYADILKQENISRNNDFFEMGGDSLQAVRLFNVLSVKYPRLLNIGDLYLHTTASELAGYINKQLLNRCRTQG